MMDQCERCGDANGLACICYEQAEEYGIEF